MKYGIVFATKAGSFTVVEEDGAVCLVNIGGAEELSDQEKEQVVFKDTALLKRARQQLMEYAEGKRKVFDLPLAARGTAFQKKVWDALCTIPYGEVRTYKQIARQVGNANACRAVGMANHNNPIGVVVPCHRVVGSDGSLTGYAGGLDKKKMLLELEQRYL